jgi:hypothetical protein
MRPRISPAALFVNVTARHAVRRHALDLHQPRDALHQHARLAAARAREHEHGHELGGDRGALRVVQRPVIGVMSTSSALRRAHPDARRHWRRSARWPGGNRQIESLALVGVALLCWRPSLPPEYTIGGGVRS